MKKIRKVMSYKFSERGTAIITLLGLLITMIPLYRLSVYSIPYYDDYGAPAGTIAWSKQFGTSYLHSAIVHAYQMWYAWEGVYFDRVLMALDPILWGEQYHFLGSVIIITSLLVSVFAFIYFICRKMLRGAKWDSLASAAIVSEITILFIYTAQQGFYWYSGGIKYVFGFSLWLITILTTILTLISRKKAANIIYGLISAILIFFVSGTNFVTVLQSLIVSVSIFIMGYLWYKKRAFYLLPMLISNFYGARLCLVAPGNAKRASAFHGMGAVEAILASFKTGFEFLGKFTDWRTLLLFLIALPISYRIVRMSGIKFRVKNFLILALWSVCLYASGFTPNLYSSGDVVLSRVINTIKFVFQILLWINMTYFLGLLSQIRTGGKRRWKGYVIWPLVIPWLAAWMFFFKIQPNPIGTYSAFGANYYLKTGQAMFFYSEYEKRVEALNGPDTDVILEPYTNMPWFLGWNDISTDPDDEVNQFMAQFYHKNSIRLRDS